MPKFRMGKHVRVRARGLDFYGEIVAYGTSRKDWRYSVASFDELYHLCGLRETEIESIDREPMPPPDATPEEIGEFWDTHSLADYWDETHEVEFQVNLKSKQNQVQQKE